MSHLNTDKGEPRLVIGVDFGTTYTGIAWAHSQLIDRLPTLDSWPVSVPDNQGRETSVKVPTRLHYGKDGKVQWGFAISHQVSPNDVLEWFKLELETKPEAAAYARDGDRCRGHDPAKVTTDFLTAVAAHVRTFIQEALGPQIFSTTPVELAITVPAIWSHLAQDRTLKACEAAFSNLSPAYGRMPIHLISEPEAAAIYTLNGIDPNSLAANDTIIVMDAGGGTVDLISYTIKSLEPLEVEEAAPGSGEKCGSTFLNQRFKDLLDRKLSGVNGFDEDVAARVMEEFEKTTKRRFMAGAGPKETYQVSVGGVAANKERGVNRGRLEITGAELHEVFRPVIIDCLGLLQGQINASIASSGKSPKAVLLVGGFGASVYLQQRVRELLGLMHGDIMFLTPADAWQAVVKGAVMRRAVAVRGRRARMHYGMKLRSRLRDDQPEKLKALATWDSIDRIYKVPKMSWFVKRGDIIRENVPYRIDFSFKRSVDDGPPQSHMAHIRFDSFDRPASRIADEKVRKLCRLEADLSLVPQSKMRRRRCKDGGLYYCLDFHIEAVFLSAQIKYSLVYQGTQGWARRRAYPFLKHEANAVEHFHRHMDSRSPAIRALRGAITSSWDIIQAARMDDTEEEVLTAILMKYLDENVFDAFMYGTHDVLDVEMRKICQSLLHNVSPQRDAFSVASWKAEALEAVIRDAGFIEIREREQSRMVLEIADQLDFLRLDEDDTDFKSSIAENIIRPAMALYEEITMSRTDYYIDWQPLNIFSVRHLAIQHVANIEDILKRSVCEDIGDNRRSLDFSRDHALVHLQDTGRNIGIMAICTYIPALCSRNHDRRSNQAGSEKVLYKTRCIVKSSAPDEVAQHAEESFLRMIFEMGG